jgi:hypothetical protein
MKTVFAGFSRIKPANIPKPKGSMQLVIVSLMMGNQKGRQEMELFEIPEPSKEVPPLFEVLEVKETTILDELVSETPVWIFCTFNAQTFNMWRKEILFPTTDFAAVVKSKLLDNRVLNRYSCIIQVQLKTQEEAERFYDSAKKCGIYPKSRYSGLVSDRTFF